MPTTTYGGWLGISKISWSNFLIDLKEHSTLRELAGSTIYKIFELKKKVRFETIRDFM
jgi:hypothetical protein